MAIGYGVPAPKGKTRKQVKARKDRADAKQLKAFRDAVWKRESDKMDAALDGRWEPGFRFNDDIASWQFAICQFCGASVHRGRDVNLTGEVHHRISRRHKATRYDPMNGVLLCNFLIHGCHEKAERGEITV